ncbi:MAG: carbon-nitrogen hydrolase family protein [Oscillospiraceae bacterium]|nr:carbon-nitrogen hydrolase family protein [Oscillospiraceae bacterium]
MKLAMAQMQMGSSIEENLHKSLHYIESAGKAGADLIFFPELQLSPFFPQYEKRAAGRWAMTLDGPELTAIRNVCRTFRLCACPNLYLQQGGQFYDASVMIDSNGGILGVSKMVHIAQSRYFYEQDYYTPSDGGFPVYRLPFGTVGVVICFDRHLPDGIQTCAKQGADLVIIPTANIEGEPLELFEWEIRVQAFQNTVFAAMCNRVGQEAVMRFVGQSLAAGPDGTLILKAAGEETLLLLDLPLEQARRERTLRPWLTL